MKAHDLGGRCGFGAIDDMFIGDGQSALFPNEWEATVFGMTLACGMLGQWNLDQTRFAREQMRPAHYLASTYYEHWLDGLERLLVERGLLSTAELQSGKAAGKGRLQAVTVERVAEILGQGAPTILPAEAAPRFISGARVRARNGTPKSHTRAPRYTRGREGVIVFHHGAHVFPDQHAASGEKQPIHLYNVRFEAHELWGEADAEGKTAVYVDLFEPYLEMVDAAP